LARVGTELRCPIGWKECSANKTGEKNQSGPSRSLERAMGLEKLIEKMEKWSNRTREKKLLFWSEIRSPFERWRWTMGGPKKKKASHRGVGKNGAVEKKKGSSTTHLQSATRGELTKIYGAPQESLRRRWEAGKAGEIKEKSIEAREENIFRCEGSWETGGT